MRKVILGVIAGAIVLGGVVGIVGAGNSSDAEPETGLTTEGTTTHEPVITVETRGGSFDVLPVRVPDEGGSSVEEGRDSILTRIAVETDCDTLLVEFETAYAHHERSAALGETELNTTHMLAVTERLQEIGCYE